MSLGIIGRCDSGGLANLTREVHRHLAPERTLIIEVPDAKRGPCITSDYTHGSIYQTEYGGAIPDIALDWLTAEGIDSLWTAEFWYDPRLLRQAHGQQIRTLCYVMPELLPDQPSRQALVPTWYRIDTVPNARLLPFPVARDRLKYRPRPEVRHLFHPVGTEFHDRNGTEILLAALPFITSDVRLTIHSPHRPIMVPADVRIDVDVIESRTFADYWDVYPPDIDLLVLPRRYAGLSLPVQECASLGVPALMLDSDPYAGEPFVNSIPSTGSRDATMKGGRIPVHSADPRALANAIDYLARNPETQVTASHSADMWAEDHAWHGALGDRWRTALGL